MLGLKAAEEGKSLDLLVSDPSLVPLAVVMDVEAHLGYLCPSPPSRGRISPRYPARTWILPGYCGSLRPSMCSQVGHIPRFPLLTDRKRESPDRIFLALFSLSLISITD